MVNYFELYGLPASFVPDAAAVKKKYYELSRRYHPDHYAQASDAERAETLRMAAMNNDAYKTLSDADRTMAYILTQAGVLEAEEKYALPPDFLMEMMDVNELVSDYELQPDNAAAARQAASMLQQQLDEWQQTTAPLVAQYDPATPDTDLLQRIKDLYFRKKYLLRIRQRINTFAAH